MRITRDSLIKAARTAVTQRTLYNRRIVCIYLTGSLLEDEPLLGGTTDIDLFFIHDSDPPVQREIQKLTDDVHLDIAHLPQSHFSHPRSLRIDPWVGPFLCQNPLVLHDLHHWFEFTQAAVCSQFHQPENRMERARPMAEEARSLWMDLHGGTHASETARLWMYLKAIERAGNTIATLTGVPLTERRFFLKLRERSQTIGRPGMDSGLSDLITGEEVTEEIWQTWMGQWSAALLQAANTGDESSRPALLHPGRLGYYTRAADALHRENLPAAVWMLLRTWTLALNQPPAEGPDSARQQSLLHFQDAARVLHLDDAHFEERLSGLDTYLDNLEETLEIWSRQNGI